MSTSFFAMDYFVTARCTKMGTTMKNRRKEQLARLYGNFCFYCAVNFSVTGHPITDITIDHVLPRSLGGSNSLLNLVLACRECNKTRGNCSFETFIATRMDIFTDEQKMMLTENYRMYLDLCGIEVYQD